MTARVYDAVLVLSFGGPDQPADVIPFLENVLRGRDVPHARMMEVAEHYYHFGGRSPINDQNRALITALEKELAEHGPRLPVYWGNRNWHPLLADTVAKMAAEGVRRALAFVTSAFGSYSGCRQYLEDIELARKVVGAHAPEIDKLPLYYNYPGFIEPVTEHVRTALSQSSGAADLFFTAHSVPISMVGNDRYETQLAEACRLVAQAVGRSDYRLVYQSRSGPPHQPWLGPDILHALRECRARNVVIAPIGFVSDHLEVVYDLDTQARELCDSLGIGMVRAATVGTHPRFVRMIRELIQDRLDSVATEECPADCCRPEKKD